MFQGMFLKNKLNKMIFCNNCEEGNQYIEYTWKNMLRLHKIN